MRVAWPILKIVQDVQHNAANRINARGIAKAECKVVIAHFLYTATYAQKTSVCLKLQILNNDASDFQST